MMNHLLTGLIVLPLAGALFILMTRDDTRGRPEEYPLDRALARRS